MHRRASVTSSLVIGLTLLVLGSVTTASKAGGEAGSAAQASPSAGTSAMPGSTATELGLSRHLNSVGARFYGAWWCPACTKQKALFGKEAAAELPYIECDKQPGDRERCMAADIKTFPTWDLKGKPRLVGVQSLDELGSWSGYRAGRQPKP